MFIIINEWDGCPDSTIIIGTFDTLYKAKKCISDIKNYMDAIKKINREYNTDVECKFGDKFGIVSTKLNEIRSIDFSNEDKSIKWDNFKW